MYVYRVENKEGLGPYSIKGGHRVWADNPNDLFNPHDSDGNHPAPWDDVINYTAARAANAVCGFETKKQLKRWFSLTELNTLRKMGFVVKVFKAEQVFTGGHQLMFTKE